MESAQLSDDVRIKAEQFEVSDPAETIKRFESLLGKLVQVPKAEIEGKRKPSGRSLLRARKGGTRSQ